MSELRFHLEKIKMDRWQKLQNRLDSVNQRRLARLAEMKKRSEEGDAEPAAAVKPSETKGVEESQVNKVPLTTTAAVEPAPPAHTSVASSKPKEAAAKMPVSSDTKVLDDLLAEQQQQSPHRPRFHPHKSLRLTTAPICQHSCAAGKL